MEQKGEFEQRPEIQPATEVPMPKPKANPLPWFLCGVFALVAIGLGVFLAFGNTKNNEKCVTAAEDQSKEPSEDKKEVDLDQKLRLMVDGVRKDLTDYFGDTFSYANSETLYRVEKSFDQYYVPYEFEKGYATGLNRTYSIDFISVTPSYLDQKMKSAGFSSDLDKIMAKNELKPIDKKALMAIVMGDESSYRAYGDDSGNICNLTLGEPLSIACSNSNWLNEEDKELVKELIDAYIEDLSKDENYSRSKDDPIFIDASVDDIVDSKSGNYQRIDASLADAAGIFYRKVSDGKWIFLIGTQQGIQCSWFDTDELKEAFEGYKCVPDGDWKVLDVVKR